MEQSQGVEGQQASIILDAKRPSVKGSQGDWL
jgi:hypothetical protein